MVIIHFELPGGVRRRLQCVAFTGSAAAGSATAAIAPAAARWMLLRLLLEC